MNEHPWTLITGASSGIGRALAERFARAGHSLVLVSRDQNKLSEVADELSEKYKETGSKFYVIAKDLSHADEPSEIFKICSEKNIHIDCLVNNAGFGVHGEFIHTDLQQELEMVNLQIGALLRLTKLFAPSMVARKSGKILNIASVYSFTPVPQQAVYSACKAFMLSFSESLACELKPFGVTVTTVCPGATQSEFRRRAGMKEKSVHSGMPAAEVARVAFEAVMGGQRISIPGTVNQLFALLSKCLPRVLLPSLMKKINGGRGVNHP